VLREGIGRLLSMVERVILRGAEGRGTD